MWTLLLALSIGQPASLLREGFEGWGDTPPAEWSATGACAIVEGGRLGGKCIAATGDGPTAGTWRTNLPLEPGRTYRVTFWARAEGTGGSITSGPDSVNRDYGLPAQWERFSSVCRIPDNAGPVSPFHLGLWEVKGTCYFDDVEVTPVAAVVCDPSGLGEGETLHGEVYEFRAPFQSEGANDARPLRSARTTYNSNRWWVYEGSEVVYEHRLGTGQVAASVAVTVGYHRAGSLRVEVSREGDHWTEIGRLEAVGSGEWEAPATLLPAERLLVRLSGSPGANLQIHGYGYRARLDRDMGSATGRTLYLAEERPTPTADVALSELLPAGVRLELRSNIVHDSDWTITARLDGAEPCSKTVRLKRNEAASVPLPFAADRVGLTELRLEASCGQDVAYRATGFVPVTVLSLSDYGEALPSEGPLRLWWCDATRKIARDRPLPSVEAPPEGIRLAAAGGEYEPFQLVLNPSSELAGPVDVQVTDLVGPDGARIPSSGISVEQVGYVEVKTPTDPTGCSGMWPDPLPPVTEPIRLTPDVNTPLWIRVFVPRGTAPGTYAGEVRLLPEGSAPLRVPVRLEAFGFDLPEKPHVSATLGLDAFSIDRYHNLMTSEEREAVWELYLRNFAEHRISPYDPMGRHPYHLRFEGRSWNGFTLDTRDAAEGKASALVVDDQETSDPGLETSDTHAVDRAQPLAVRFAARTPVEGQAFLVTVRSYDADGAWMPGCNVDIACEGSTEWKRHELTIEPGRLREGATRVSLLFRPVLWSETGGRMGSIHIDDVFLGEPGGPNLVEDAGFEAGPASPKATIDWTEFDKAATRCLDEMGMPVFALNVQGLGSGTFFSRTPGEIAGHRAGTPEYEAAMRDYLGQVEAHLREKGWLDKAYVYWFDEPEPKDYDFVREGMATIHRHAPGVARMLTEQPEEELFGSVDIWCPISNEFRKEQAEPRMAEGERFWWYVCTGPKAPWCTLFIDHPATDLRVWLWQSFGNGITGILVWASNYWTSGAAFPDTPQNPWSDPMSYVSGYGLTPGQVQHWGNGDGRFLYPPNRDPSDTTTKYLEGPVNSIRWEMLREGIEDYEYLATLRDLIVQARRDGMPEKMLEPYERLLTVPAEITESATRYTVDSTPVYEQRRRVAEAIVELARELGN